MVDGGPNTKWTYMIGARSSRKRLRDKEREGRGKDSLT